MELSTVGAVVAFAIKLEDCSCRVYANAASLITRLPARDVLESLADSKRERRQVLERSRREFVNEMLLEPIEGLEVSDDLLGAELLAGLNCHAVLQMAREREEKSQKLYLKGAAKIGHLPQLARVFKKLGQGNADHVRKLGSLASRIAG
jgi:rubrerythrin